MPKRVVYQIDPKRKNADGSYPDFVFKNRVQKFKEIYWIYVLWTGIKYRASLRGIPFGLRLATFFRFCRKSNYHRLRGNRADELTVDRRNNLKGYYAFNIQALTHYENAMKYHRVDKKRGKRGYLIH